MVKAQAYNFFLALMPEREESERIASMAAEWREELRLRGKCFKPERLHMTVAMLGKLLHEAPSAAVIDAACSAVSSAGLKRPLLRLDHAISFGKEGPQKKPFVLRCDEAGDERFKAFSAPLTPAWRRTGLTVPPVGLAHMTLLYDSRKLEVFEIAPIQWHPRRCALMLSHVGESRHERLAEWMLPD